MLYMQCNCRAKRWSHDWQQAGTGMHTRSSHPAVPAHSSMPTRQLPQGARPIQQHSASSGARIAQEECLSATVPHMHA
jgi:hypothetical protein